MSIILPPNRFVGLHAHSGFSTNDGLGYPDKHIDFVLQNGMDAWALTDHGSGNGLAHAHTYSRKMRSKGRKYRQIYGVEFYFVPSLTEWSKQRAAHFDAKRAKNTEGKPESIDILAEDEITGGLVVEDEEETKSNESSDADEWKRRYHLVVFAKNRVGLKSLFNLVKRSYVDGYYKFPRIDYDMLKSHSEGLVVSTACVTGDAEVITDIGAVSLKSVIDRHKKGEIPLVLSYNETTKRPEFKPVTWGALTKKNAKILKITTADGKCVRLTPDHNVLTDKGWMRADEIMKNMPIKIMSL